MKSKINMLIAVLTVALVSCLENEIEYNTDNLDLRSIELAAPLAKIHVPMYGFLEELLEIEGLEEMDIDGVKVLCLKYTHSDVFDWRDQINIQRLGSAMESNGFSSMPDWGWDLIGIGNSPVTETIRDVLTLTTGEAGTYITEAELSSGTLRINIVPPTNITGDFTIKIPEIKEPFGNSFRDFERTFTGRTNTSPPVRDIDITGFKIVPTNKNLNLECQITVRRTSSSGGTISGNVAVGIEITDLDVRYMAGYFGQLIYDLDRDMDDLDFFEDFNIGSNIGIKGVGLEMVINNPVGMPANVGGKLFFTDDTGSWSQELLMEDDFDIDIAPAVQRLVGGRYEVTPTTTRFSTNIFTNNGAIEFTNPNFPTAIKFVNVEGFSNPKGDIPAGTNFIVKDENYDAVASVDLTLTMPLWFKIEDFVHADTISFDYRKNICNDDEEYSKSIERAALNIAVTDNGLPFDFTITMYVPDPAYPNDPSKNVHTFFIDKKVDANIPISLTRNVLDSFWEKDVKNIVLKVVADTKNKDYVKITKDKSQSIDIKVSADIKANIPSSIFD